MDKQPHGAWYALLDPRQQATIDHALAYERDYSHAGVPGHSAHLLIAKLARLLDERAVQKPSNDLLTPAEAKPIDLTRAPDVSKKPGGFA